MDWDKQIVRLTLEGAGEFPCVQLEILLRRLEACPEALPAIANAIEDMAAWNEKNAKGIRLYLASKQARERLAAIVNLKK